MTAFAVPSRRLLVGGGLVALATFACGCHGSETVLSKLDRARALTANLRVELGKANDASNRAVMADTDEASAAFAGEAASATLSVERDVAALWPLLRALGFPGELRALAAFQGHWSKYRSLDRDILALAVENTNLKAQRLSFGAAREAADGFRASVTSIAAKIPSKDRYRAELLATQAVLAVREIQVLHAPHIAESDDPTMTRLEREMTALDARAREAVTALSQLAAPTAGSTFVTALAELNRFKDVSDQIVSLSRRNSNVRSLALALSEKPALTAACDDSLRAVQDALATEGSKATR